MSMIATVAVTQMYTGGNRSTAGQRAAVKIVGCRIPVFRPAQRAPMSSLHASFNASYDAGRRANR